jgi:hypothetical protein
MSRGLLGKKILKGIAAQLPDIEQLSLDILTRTPEVVSFRFPQDSTIPVASVCLHDTLYTLADATTRVSRDTGPPSLVFRKARNSDRENGNPLHPLLRR